MSSEQFTGPWLPWFHGDFLRATQGWTLLERGAYFMLLGASWEVGPLPVDKKRLASILGIEAPVLDEVWPVVGPRFSTTDRGLVNTRLEQHRATQALRSERARQSALARWGNRSDHANASASALRTQSVGNATGHAPAMLPDPDPDPDPDPKPRHSRAGARSPIHVPEFHREVIAAYHDICVDLPAIKGWSSKRLKALDARIAERVADGKPADQVAYWREFFAAIAASDFLCGRASGFRASLDWLLALNNFLKVIEGNYTNSQRTNGASHANR